MLAKYDIKNKTDETNAMKEIIQEIVLCGLSRGGFFDVAAFYGGTALRIFYGLNRFSEDLDFALLKPDKEFDSSKYFSYIEKEVESYGLNLTITTRKKRKESNITSAFLKGDTKEHILKFFLNENMKNVTSLKDIKIKIEVDVNPPSGAEYEFKYKLVPSPHQIRLYDESSLFTTASLFKLDRSKEDILYEIMLKYGIFDQPASEVRVNGKMMYRVGQRHMIVCLEDKVDEKDIDEICKLGPRVVVFKEDGFMDDNAKINAEYNLKKAGVEDVKCV